MGLRRAVIIIFIIALLPLSILEVKADSNIGYQELVEVEVNSADTVEMENARYNRPDSISVISGDSVGALFQDSVPVMITDSLGGLAPSCKITAHHSPSCQPYTPTHYHHIHTHILIQQNFKHSFPSLFNYSIISCQGLTPHPFGRSGW